MRLDTHAPATVLLVEDNLADVELIRTTLEGFERPIDLLTARDGLEALEILRKEGIHAGASTPHLVLLDLNMPRMDGRELLGHVKQDPKLRRIPVIILTSSESEDEVAAAYDLQASAYVAKPFGLEALIQFLRALDAFWLGHVVFPPR
jgi:CheY-like chemotaxis protein